MKKGNSIYVSAIIVAAGKGTRMNMDVNKQYIDVCGKPLLTRTLQIFQDCSFVDEIIVVVNSKDIFYCKKDIIEEYGMDKVKYLVAGGTERQNSVYNGLMQVDRKTDIVLIHDGARPFVAEDTIIDCIESAIECGVSTVGVPVKDTIKVSDGGGYVEKTLNRSKLWSIQTPQAFKYDLIVKAHEKALKEGYTGTDDTVLSEEMLGVRTRLVMGSYENIKITTQEDLIFAEAIIRNIEG